MGLDSYWNKVQECEAITVKESVEFNGAEASNTLLGTLIKLSDGRWVKPRIAFDIVEAPKDFLVGECICLEKDVDLSKNIVPLARRITVKKDKVLLEGSLDNDFGTCGGMFSGHGQSSFRGKVYDSIVDGVTGVSLYTDDKIPNETVREMASKLAETPWEIARQYDQWELSEDDYKGLVEMFQAHAEAGHVLTAWY